MYVCICVCVHTFAVGRKETGGNPELYPCHGQGGSQSFLLTSDGILMLTASQFTLALCPDAGASKESLAFASEADCRARGRVVFAEHGATGTLKWVPSSGVGGGCIVRASVGTGIAVRPCAQVGAGRWELLNVDRVE